MKILFMCVANSARSQLAEGLAKKLFAAHVQVESAGSAPTKVNAYAIRALSELGIDASAHHSKRAEDLPREFLGGLNYVITLCAEEVCPVLISNATKLHWPLPDPAGQKGTEEVQLERFRIVRDELHRRLLDFGKSQGLLRGYGC